jgi:transposase-like protein
VAADEIFDGERPHLVMVEPQSLLIVELSCQDHRDALTWGVTLLECAKGGVKIEQVVSDGAQGLKKGIAEAELGIVHQLDLFHTLWEALRVEKS